MWYLLQESGGGEYVLFHLHKSYKKNKFEILCILQSDIGQILNTFFL